VKPFPIPFSTSFNTFPVDGNALYFSDMEGSFVVYQNLEGNKVLRQIVRQPGISWCGDSQYPISIIGDWNMGNYMISSKIFIEEASVYSHEAGRAFLGARVGAGSQGSDYCSSWYSYGYFLAVTSAGSWSFMIGKDVLQTGTVDLKLSTWATIGLSVNNNQIIGQFNGAQLFRYTDTNKNSSWTHGWAAIGSGWHFLQFDDFSLSLPNAYVN